MASNVKRKTTFGSYVAHFSQRMAVNLCVYTQQKRVAVVEGKIRKPGAADATEQEAAE